MFFALCRFEIFIPEGRSLKAKRSVMNRIKERLRTRFHASVSEVATQDLWQRGTFGVALIGARPAALEAGLAAMRRMVEQEPRCQITSWDERVEPFTGEGDKQVISGGDSSANPRPWFEVEEGDEFYGAV